MSERAGSAVPHAVSKTDGDWIARYGGRRDGEDAQAFKVRAEMIAIQLAKLNSGPVEVSQIAEIYKALEVLMSADALAALGRRRLD